MEGECIGLRRPDKQLQIEHSRNKMTLRDLFKN